MEAVARLLALLDRPCQLCHWRSHGGGEVDLVLESGERLVPVEIKTGSQVGADKLRGLRSFLGDFPERAPFGLVLYGGRQVLRAGTDVLLVPWPCALATESPGPGP